MLSSIGRTDPPFLISSNIYGGGGYLAPRANGIGIVGRKLASLEYGGVRAYVRLRTADGHRPNHARPSISAR
jgi:hypothetical protein